MNKHFFFIFLETIKIILKEINIPNWLTLGFYTTYVYFLKLFAFCLWVLPWLQTQSTQADRIIEIVKCTLLNNKQWCQLTKLNSVSFYSLKRHQGRALIIRCWGKKLHFVLRQNLNKHTRNLQPLNGTKKQNSYKVKWHQIFIQWSQKGFEDHKKRTCPVEVKW